MTRINSYSVPGRFYSLDILRGVAALSVVLFHWRHCFYLCTSHAGFTAENQPFYSALYFFYEQGQKAVELFFTLSGFIFFWLYSDKITNRLISFTKFSILRLSRLYPLHFVTLIIVVLLQSVYQSIFNCHFVYAFNDLYHFVLHLFFASNWGFQKGFSYNGPIWSVSIEILLYILFFIICWFRKDSLLILFLIIFVSYGVFYYHAQQLAQGVFSFFVGGVTYKIFSMKFTEIISGIIGKFIVIVAVIAWLITLVEVHYSIFGKLFSELLVSLSINQKYTFLFDRRIPLFIGGLLFPLTILALVILEVKKGSLGKRFAFIGDISYSSYLLHFPLQLTMVLLANRFGYTYAVFESPVLLLLFFAVLITLSFLSHRFFEMPVQDKLRKMFLKKRQVA
ncbi:acyltransferase family protein [Larkinella terrae]|uniref:Acyltransferase family protein n=1 Tax=Larkinella terrae TaxID=2025311 RepID=A0A7K0EUY1_9BACT|nr:acyltransferase [Larkinella terrae]MRS65625.1 acyltransferase family protein [Larkinella terrae]